MSGLKYTVEHKRKGCEDESWKSQIRTKRGHGDRSSPTGKKVKLEAAIKQLRNDSKRKQRSVATSPRRGGSPGEKPLFVAQDPTSTKKSRPEKFDHLGPKEMKTCQNI